jgi:EF-P beta-lysylation protein EpmB
LLYKLPQSLSTLDPTAGRTPTWQQALREAVRDVAELAALLDLPLRSLTDVVCPGADFPLLVPRGFVARMRKGDMRDPLLLQVLPRSAELLEVAGFTADPVEEIGLAESGVVRKYARRVLLIASGACPVHCRYCFRRAFPYQSQQAGREEWAQALSALRNTPDVDEVILSGGDPLTLGNRRLSLLFAGLAELGTVSRVRIHTRFPIVLPERIDAGFCAILEETPLATVMVVHANHANEFDSTVAAALGAVTRTSTTVLNQSVLLRGVNDDVDALANLSERAFACGALPYYLHLLDRVAGAAHFDVDEPRARALHAALTARLPGYLVPRLVREIPGRPSKTLIA